MQFFYVKNIHGRTTNIILDKLTEVYGQPAKLSKPDGITSISHILGVFPYTSPIKDMDPKYITTGLIASKDAKLLSPEDINIEKLSGANIGIDTDKKGTISIEWSPYPDKSKLTIKDNTLDISLYGNNGEVLYQAVGNRLFDYSWVYGAVKYKADIYVNGELIDTVVDEDEVYQKKYELNPNDEVLVLAYYGFENGKVKSNEIKKEAKIDDPLITVSFPDATVTSRDDITAWAKKNGVDYKITEKIANNNYPAGTVRVVKVNASDEYYKPDEKAQFKKSILMETTFDVHIYKDNKFSITLGAKEDDFKPGNKIKLQVKPEQAVTWSIQGNASIEEGELLVIDKAAKTGDSIKISATSKDSGHTDTIEIKVK